MTCYLSAEFLMGPQLGNNLLNLQIEARHGEALAALGQDLDEVIACEKEPGLGNGGLGRLAACYLDSLATLERPSIGYGIRYEFGIFHQEIHDGWQVEKTDNWLVYGNPWEIDKPDASYLVNWGGYTEQYTTTLGRPGALGPAAGLKGISYDTPIQGYGVNTCNTLTLWSARAVKSFALEAFNTGDFYKAVEDEVIPETVSKVLYPNDEPEAGKRLRLLQQYFFVTCSLQDILHIHQRAGRLPLSALPEKVGDPAQRHSSVDRRRRADAAADRRARPGLGRGVGNHGGDLRLHQPHPAARGAGNLAAVDLRRIAAAPPGDHLRDQRPLPRRGARPFPATKTGSAGCR